jgi:hypothetical protein
MATRKLDPADWQAYFDRVGQGLGPRTVQIEVAALDLGDQVEAQWIGLTDLSYDPKSAAIYIGTDQVHHRIERPQEVWVREGPDGLEAIEVLRPDGTQEIVRLAGPLLLPGPRDA